MRNGNFLKYRTGRPATDYVTDITGQMKACVKRGIDYPMEDAMKKRRPFFEGHCEHCGLEKQSQLRMN